MKRLSVLRIFSTFFFHQLWIDYFNKICAAYNDAPWRTDLTLRYRISIVRRWLLKKILIKLCFIPGIDYLSFLALCFKTRRGRDHQVKTSASDPVGLPTLSDRCIQSSKGCCGRAPFTTVGRNVDRRAVFRGAPVRSRTVADDDSPSPSVRWRILYRAEVKFVWQQFVVLMFVWL